MMPEEMEQNEMKQSPIDNIPDHISEPIGRPDGVNGSRFIAKHCRICGDKAFGFNFTVICCESCKAFFRRNLGREKDFHCPFGGNCSITVQSRKHCQKCRLRKCYQVGMRADRAMLRSRHDQSNQRQTNVASIRIPLGSDTGLDVDGIRNRSGSTEDNNYQGGKESSDGSVELSATIATSRQRDNIQITVSMPRAAFPNNNISETDLARRLLSAVASASSSMMMDQNGTSTGTTPTSDTTSTAGTPTEEDSEKIKDNKWPAWTDHGSRSPSASEPLRTTPSGCVLPLVTVNHRRPRLEPNVNVPEAPPTFSGVLPLEIRYAKLEELVKTSQTWTEISATVPPLKGHCADDFTTEDFRNLLHYLLTGVIKQHCQLRGFKELPLADRIALMKARIGELLVIRAAGKYNSRTGRLHSDYPGRPYLCADIAKRIAGGVQEETIRVLSCYPEPLRWNETITLILSALALFNPDGVSLEKKGAVEAERQVYLHLFRDYLESTFGSGESHWAFMYLANWMSYVSARAKDYTTHAKFELDPVTFDILELECSAFQ